MSLVISGMNINFFFFYLYRPQTIITFFFSIWDEYEAFVFFYLQLPQIIIITFFNLCNPLCGIVPRFLFTKSCLQQGSTYEKNAYYSFIYLIIYHYFHLIITVDVHLFSLGFFFSFSLTISVTVGQCRSFENRLNFFLCSAVICKAKGLSRAGSWRITQHTGTTIYVHSTLNIARLLRSLSPDKLSFQF